MENITYEEMLYENAINVAKFHKRNCSDGECGVSLRTLRELIEKSGFKIQKEHEEFFY